MKRLRAVEDVLVAVAAGLGAHRGARPSPSPARSARRRRAPRPRRAAAGTAASARRCPASLNAERAELLHGEDQPARRADLRDLLDRRRASCSALAPIPPYSSSASVAKMPFSRKSSTTSHGNSADLSISAARGAIRSRASGAHELADLALLGRQRIVRQLSRGATCSPRRRVGIQPSRDPRERPRSARWTRRSRPSGRSRSRASRIAGGVGVHETALASPEVVDLGGRVVVPGLHRLARPLPDLGARADGGRPRRLRVARRGAARIAGAARGPGAWSAATAGGAATGAGGASRRAHDLDAVTGETPAAMIAKDYHSLWLNSAALALAGGDLEVEGGVVERDARGEPTGVLREEAAWRFKERHLVVPDDVLRRRDAGRAEARRRARRHRGARQGRLARRAPALAAPRASAAR